MTALETYKEAFANEVLHIDKPTKELAEQWLDAKIDALEQLRRICEHQKYPLTWGDLDEDDGDYPNEIDICGMASSLDIGVHIYRGIEQLAELLGKELRKEGRYDKENPYDYVFDYKGYRVFQIGK